jgi:hypothetical protein
MIHRRHRRSELDDGRVSGGLARIRRDTDAHAHTTVMCGGILRHDRTGHRLLVVLMVGLVTVAVAGLLLVGTLPLLVLVGRVRAPSTLSTPAGMPAAMMTDRVGCGATPGRRGADEDENENENTQKFSQQKFTRAHERK